MKNLKLIAVLLALFLASCNDSIDLTEDVAEQQQIWNMIKKRNAAKANDASWKTSHKMGKPTVMRQPDFGIRHNSKKTEAAIKKKRRGRKLTFKALLLVLSSLPRNLMRQATRRRTMTAAS